MCVCACFHSEAKNVILFAYVVINYLMAQFEINIELYRIASHEK